MSVVVAIPARYQSARFPGKPLVELTGASGEKRTLVERTYRAAKAAKGIDRVIVATDDARIAAHAHTFGAEVMMTSPKWRNGTERCAEVLERLTPTPSLIVNVQGDAPLTPPDFVEALVDGIGKGDVATPVLRCDAGMLDRFRADRREGRVGGTLAVMDRNMRALYFSKEVIPYADHIESDKDAHEVFHHVGLYAFTPSALKNYLEWAPGVLEMREGLEQLRFLENGASVTCVEVESHGRPFWELNNPVDVERIERALGEAHIA